MVSRGHSRFLFFPLRDRNQGPLSGKPQRDAVKPLPAAIDSRASLHHGASSVRLSAVQGSREDAPRHRTAQPSQRAIVKLNTEVAWQRKGRNRKEVEGLTFRGRTSWCHGGTDATISRAVCWRLQHAVIGLLCGLGRHGCLLLAQQTGQRRRRRVCLSRREILAARGKRQGPKRRKEAKRRTGWG